MNCTTRLSLLLLLILAAPAVAAAEIFTWVDEQGVTHFSETPPPEATPDLQLIAIEPDYPARDEQTQNADDFYSVINQAERMTARRLENEKLAAEKRQANAEASKALAEASAIEQAEYNSDNYDRYYPIYPYYPRKHHPKRPGHGHKPVHPIQPAPVRPRGTRASLGKTPGMPR